ncbi:MAG: hypothetical protein L0Z55_11435, partial [Planctomycetes bacterium]|nr:hypothetical protein [Planctomycetota bacterium]
SLIAALEELSAQVDLPLFIGEALAGDIAAAPSVAGQQATLLFHAGRLRGDPAALRRAAEIAPALLVRARNGRAFVSRPIAPAVRRLHGEAEPRRVLPALPPLEIAVGESRTEGVLRLRNDLLPIEGEWHVVSWSEVRELPEAKFDFTWDPHSVRIAGEVTWHAGSLHPIDAVVRVPSVGWLVVGRGVALIDESSRAEVFRVECARPVWIYGFPWRVVSELAPEVLEFLRRLQPPAFGSYSDSYDSFWKAVACLDDLPRSTPRLRDLSIESAFHDGEHLLIASSNGWSARFAPGPPPAFPPLEIDGYTRVDRRWHWRATPADHPLAALGEDSATVPATLERAWSYRSPTPYEFSPAGDATASPEWLRAPPLPKALAGETITAFDGDFPRACLTGSGYLLYYSNPCETPAWIAKLNPTLPGPNGFVPPRLASGGRDQDRDDDRGPHAAGPRYSRRAPGVRIAGEDILVVTDTVTRIGRDGEHADLLPPLASERIQDVVVDRRGVIWVLTSRKLFEASLPNSGVAFHGKGASRAVDLECIGDRVFALCYDGLGFSLYAATSHPPEPGGPRLRLRRLHIPPIEMESDRAGLRITSLGRWGNTLLLLHDKLYAAAIGGERLEWRVLIEWPGQDPLRHPFYLQTPPRVAGNTLIVARPWGVVEGWEAGP